MCIRDSSTHYLVDRNGTILITVDEVRRAWHAGLGDLPYPPFYHNNMNNHSIGIEILGISAWEDMKIFMNKSMYDQIDPIDLGYTDAQYEAVTWLVNDISRRNNIPLNRCRYIGHSEWAPARRTDPGEFFNWTRVGLAMNRTVGECDHDRRASFLALQRSLCHAYFVVFLPGNANNIRLP
eukprot:TRINITY_DN7789_c0_g1_i2.p2 TRINITY_DN7789_c0_g1~~TRINITY_DN7789_c0_g1_i2.p2  ORF type:complete len:211 (-),score=36.09 TRINITY_DN7789_c0_g1_i2:223-762(-)